MLGEVLEGVLVVAVVDVDVNVLDALKVKVDGEALGKHRVLVVLEPFRLAQKRLDAIVDPIHDDKRIALKTDGE